MTIDLAPYGLLPGRLKVAQFMLDGQPYTADQIAASTGIHTATVTRIIRSLREPKNGGFTVNVVPINAHLTTYQLVPTSGTPPTFEKKIRKGRGSY